MLKAIFLDMDQTLCDTLHADRKAHTFFTKWLTTNYPQLSDPHELSARYIAGIYKKLNHVFVFSSALLPDEQAFRTSLIQEIFAEQNITLSAEQAEHIQQVFDQERFAHFDFFDGAKEMLLELRKRYKLVVITNGSTFSQYPKLAATNMQDWVDHIIVGGEELQEKPAESIFLKALNLAGVNAHEALHVGDSLEADIVGAKQSGIISVWINASNKFTSNLTIQPDFTISHITDLVNILELVCNQENEKNFKISSN